MRGCAVLLSLLAFSVHAAEVTRVASSFDEKKPFGMSLEVGFERTQDRAKITREWYEAASGGLTDVSELRYTKIDTRLNLDAFIGLYKDLQFHFGVPVLFQQDRYWAFSKGTLPSNTTLYRNCGDASGRGCTTPGQGTNHLFEVGDANKPTASFRGGLGDLTFGLAYAFFSQARDDTKPTWVVSVDYTAPTSPVINPSIATASDSRGATGDRIHRYKFSTSISKRIGPLDPYFVLHYTLPWLGPGTYSNCDDPSATRLGNPQNCGKSVWNRTETGIKPAHVGGFQFGGEFNLFERPERNQKLAIDLRGWLTYTSEGRYYNEMSDLVGKLLYNSDYMQVGGHFGIVGHAAEFIHLKAYASWAYNTEHFLSSESIGQDLNTPGQAGFGTVDPVGNPIELNPNFDSRIDRVGRRFRISEQMVFRLNFAVSFNF